MVTEAGDQTSPQYEVEEVWDGAQWQVIKRTRLSKEAQGTLLSLVAPVLHQPTQTVQICVYALY